MPDPEAVGQDSEEELPDIRTEQRVISEQDAATKSANTNQTSNREFASGKKGLPLQVQVTDSLLMNSNVEVSLDNN